MKAVWHKFGWIAATLVGSVVFAAGFSLFLEPNGLNPGGISGLAMILVELLGFGSVGSLTIVINLPLFILGGMKIGKRFFAGSLIGLLVSALYGGVLCGLGLGVVYLSGGSTGGSDILVRLLKLRYRNVPIGQISLCFDAFVVVLTGLVFRDVSKALYAGVEIGRASCRERV